MTATNGAGSAMAASATGNLRPRPHAQFRLLPVPLRDLPEWNARVEQDRRA